MIKDLQQPLKAKTQQSVGHILVVLVVALLLVMNNLSIHEAKEAREESADALMEAHEAQEIAESRTFDRYTKAEAVTDLENHIQSEGHPALVERVKRMEARIEELEAEIDNPE